MTPRLPLFSYNLVHDSALTLGGHSYAAERCNRRRHVYLTNHTVRIVALFDAWSCRNENRRYGGIGIAALRGKRIGVDNVEAFLLEVNDITAFRPAHA